MSSYYITIMLPIILATTAAIIAAPNLFAPIREHRTPHDLAREVGGGFVNANGYQLWYSDHGSHTQTPIVLLHGFSAWSFSWRAVQQALLAANQRVITFDLIGCGASERVHSPVYSTHSQAEMVIAALDALGVSKFTILGHSFGGRLAMQIALLAPERVEAITAICPEAFATERPAVAGMVKAPIVGFAMTFYATSPYLVRSGLKLTVKNSTCLTDELVAGYARPLAVRGTTLSQVWQAKSPKDGKLPVPHYLAEIRCPALLIWGEQDPIFPVSDGQRLRDTLPNARLVVIPSVGHLPHEEAPETTIQAICAALT